MKNCLRIILILLSWAVLNATASISLDRPAAAQDVGRPSVTKKAPRPGLPDAPVLPKLCPVLSGPVILKLKCTTEVEKQEEEKKICDDPDLAPVTREEIMKALKRGCDIKVRNGAAETSGKAKNGDGKNGNGKKGNGENGDEDEEEGEAGLDRQWSVSQQG